MEYDGTFLLYGGLDPEAEAEWGRSIEGPGAFANHGVVAVEFHGFANFAVELFGAVHKGGGGVGADSVRRGVRGCLFERISRDGFRAGERSGDGGCPRLE